MQQKDIPRDILGSEAEPVVAPIPRVRYWDAKFLAINSILILIIAVAAYLQYGLYPSLMSSSGYGESNLTLVLSFLTYRFDFNRCAATCPGPRLSGVPALDFVQIFVIVLVLVHISHFLAFRRVKRARPPE